MASRTKTVALVWAAYGGLSDVGKMAAMHGQLMTERGEPVVIKPVALYDGKKDSPTHGLEATDVVPSERVQKVVDALANTNVEIMDVNAKETEEKLAATFAGAHAVVATPGSRQPGNISRFLALGTNKIISAMHTAGVRRLVLGSSMGIGDDFLPTTPFGLFWAGFLRIFLRAAYADLKDMESLVFNTKPGEVDFLLVRAMGLAPEEPVMGAWRAITAPGQGVWDLAHKNVAKEDIGRFMFEEALRPTRHNVAVTLGHRDLAGPLKRLSTQQ